MAGDEWQPRTDVRTTSAPRGDRPREGRGSVRGIANDVSARSEHGQGGSWQVLSFRVDAFDPHGDRYVPVPVELRGYTLRGYVGNGHEVVVEGEYEQGTLRASGLTNLTTGATVEARDVPRWAKRAIVTVFAVIMLVVLVVIGGVIAVIASQAGSFGATF